MCVVYFRKNIMNLAKLLYTKEDLINPPSSDEPQVTDKGELETMSQAELITSEADLTDEAEGIDKINTGFTDAENSVDTLNEVQEELKSGEEVSPGVSALEEAAVEATHESIMHSLGIPMVFPTMESIPYTSKREKLIATLEDAKKGIIDRMVEGLKVLCRGILNFIQGLLRNTWVLRKYYDYVKKKVERVTGSPSQDKMTKSAVAMSVTGEAGMHSVPPMLNTAMSFLEISDQLVERSNKLNFKFVMEESDETFDQFSTVNHKSVPMRNNDSSVGYLTGDRAIGSTTGQFILSGLHKQVGNHTPRTAEEIAVASKNDMGVLLKSADAILLGLKKFDSKHSKMKTIISNVLNFVASAATVYPSFVSKTARKTHHAQNRLITIRTVLSISMSRLPLEAFKTAKAFIDYANNSAKYYTDKDGGPVDNPGELLQIGTNKKEKIHPGNFELVD